jgi:hypothetical protein
VLALIVTDRESCRFVASAIVQGECIKITVADVRVSDTMTQAVGITRSSMVSVLSGIAEELRQRGYYACLERTPTLPS